MSFFDIEQLSPEDLISQFVLESRAGGLFLPYQDHCIISEWLAAAASADELLVVLSETLPAYFAPKPAGRGAPRALTGVRKLVLSRLNDRRMRTAPVR